MANWKSHKSLAESAAFAEGFPTLTPRQRARIDVVLFPPFLALSLMASRVAGRDDGLAIGAQAVSATGPGAFTGEVSAAMLRDAGARYALVGHSERRRDQGEDGPVTGRKVRAVLDAGMCPVLCFGEQLDERRAHREEHVWARQLEDGLPRDLSGVESEGLIIAYEPVWAIGTGLVPEREQLAAAAAGIRRILARLLGERGAAVPLLYGGSVKRDNAGAILSIPGYQGLLIGGAGLDPRHLADIVAAVPL